MRHNSRPNLSFKTVFDDLNTKIHAQALMESRPNKVTINLHTTCTIEIRDTFQGDGDASRDVLYGEWYPLPIRLRNLGERCKLPQRGSGRSPGRKRICYVLSSKERISARQKRQNAF